MLIEAERCFSMIEENNTNTCTHASLFSLLKHSEPYKSSSDKLSLSIGIVAYAQVFWGQPLSKQLYAFRKKRSLLGGQEWIVRMYANCVCLLDIQIKIETQYMGSEIIHAQITVVLMATIIISTIILEKNPPL